MGGLSPESAVLDPAAIRPIRADVRCRNITDSLSRIPMGQVQSSWAPGRKDRFFRNHDVWFRILVTRAQVNIAPTVI